MKQGVLVFSQIDFLCKLNDWVWWGRRWWGEKWISRDVKLVTCRREVITSPPPTGVPARQPWRKSDFFVNELHWCLEFGLCNMNDVCACRGDACSWFELEIKSTHVDIAKEAENHFYTLHLLNSKVIYTRGPDLFLIKRQMRFNH